jgi:hypothetical protein
MTPNTMTTSSNIIQKMNNIALAECCYSVNIPITKEGLLINIAPPKKCFEKLMPLYSCTFQGFRKLSNGETGEIEKKHLIHEVGDWIINVDHQQTERLTFDQVKELLQSKILERRQINIGDLQMTFASITNVFRKFTLTTKDHRLEQNRIQKTFQSNQSLEQRKEILREKDRLRKQLKRSMMSPEEKEEWRAKVRIYQQERRMNQSEEKKEDERVKSKECIKQKRQNQSEEQREFELMTAREYTRERRRNQSEEQREAELMTTRENTRERRRNQSEVQREVELMTTRENTRERRRNQSEEQREVELMTAREYMRERRKNQSEEQKEVERVKSRQRSYGSTK